MSPARWLLVLLFAAATPAWAGSEHGERREITQLVQTAVRHPEVGSDRSLWVWSPTAGRHRPRLGTSVAEVRHDRATVSLSRSGERRRLIFYLSWDGRQWSIAGSDDSEVHRLLFLWGAAPAIPSADELPPTEALRTLGERIPEALSRRDVPLPPLLGGGLAAVKALVALRQYDEPVLEDAFYSAEHHRAALLYRDAMGRTLTIYLLNHRGSWLVFGHTFGSPALGDMFDGAERRLLQ